MGTVSEANSKRKYSWWWDSHISPKNSKWLQENLTDMDVKVKQMIKLIEEDADSFARRAEMYYKKRPELMKLVEEFYRAYRALAERYDHATGVLHQAHRTMAEAFPNQIPFVLTDESPTGPLADGDPRTPDSSSMRAFVDPDELQSDALGSSSSIFHTAKRSGAFTDESDTGAGRKGLRQLSDSLGSGQVVNHSRFAEGRIRKGLNFSNPDEGSQDLKARVPSESERVGKAEEEIVTLKNALAKLQSEKEAGLLQYRESLERLSKLESEVSRAKEDSMDLNDRASKAESEVQTLKLALGKVEAEREASYLQYQRCLDKIANLENSVSLAQKDAGELSERASGAETETQSLKEDITRLESEKDAALLQLKLSLDMKSDLREKLRLAEEEAKRSYERAEEAEREIEILKQALAELINEKETASAQYKQCLERISLLEHKLACAEEEVGRLKSELDNGVAKFKVAEERCLLLETSNQTMHSELESISQRVAAQTEELTEKQKEMGRLWTCVQEEHLRFVEAETAFQTLQHLHSQSQEELRSMAVELQNRAQISEGLETRNHILQNELAQVEVENKGLSEVNLSSTLTIQNLQGEISSLRETIGKLEAEVELRVDQRNALQQEIYCLKEEINELNKKHLAVMNQVESIGYSSESFGSSVKNLQEESTKLKVDLEKERSENEALLGKLEIMEKLIAKNAVLENSLSDLNVELEEVRQKLKSLEESYQFLLADKGALASEKTTLVSQLLVATEHLEKVTEKNLFLENSLLDANAELESLRLKLKSLEELYKAMQNEKSDLVIAKGSLTSELDITQKRLEDLEKNFRELTDNYYNLEKDKDAILDEVQELRVSLDAQKKEYASLAQFSESQLASMASKICLLEEEVLHRIKKYEDEVEKDVNSQIEIFIWQRWVRDMEERNISLLLQYQKLLAASKLSDKLISELESEKTAQKAKVQSLFDQIKTLKMGLYRVIRTLEPGANQWYEGKAEQDLLNYVVDKIEETEELLFGNEQLVIENSVLVSLLGELQIEVANLATAKDILDQELTTRMEQQLVLQGESQKLVELNAGLQVKVAEGQNKEDILRDELKNLQGQLLDSELGHKNMLEENSKMLSEQRLLMQSLSTLKAEKCNLEEEICAAFGESVSQGIHSSLLRDIIFQKSLEVEKLIGNLDELNYTNYDLKWKVEIMESKLEKLSSVENENAALQKMVDNLKCNCGELEVIRADQERQLLTLSRHYDEQSREVECIHEENKKLEIQQLVLQGESQKLVELNAGLQVKVAEGQNKEDILRDELKNLQGQLLDSELGHKNMLEENSKMLSEQRLSMQSLSTLKAEKCNLEEEICAAFCESVSQGIHSSLLRDIIFQKSLEVEKLIGNLDELNYTNYDLKWKVEIMESKLEKLSSVENENAALQKMIENLKCNCGELEVIRADQERQLLTLSRHYDEQSREVECIHEENKKLEIELCKLHEEYVVTKSREDNLNHELRKERDELEEWESQATALFGELQISAVTEAILEEKVRELVKACELHQDRDCSRIMEIDQLKETVRTLEGVNEGHTAHMTAIIPVFNSLRDSVTSLESHTLPHENCAQANGKDAKDDTTIVHTDWCQQLSEGENAMFGGGLLALQEMQMKIRAIENAVMEKERHLMVENINANSKLEAAMRQIEKLKSRSSLHRQGSSKGKHANPRPEVEELEPVVVDHLRTRKQKHEISEEEVMTKDIILDQISDCSPHGISRREADNQMLEIWEATNKNGNIGLTVGKSQKEISSPNGKKHSRRHPSSDSLVEKEVNVDKLEISKRFSGSFQETSERKVLERLDSDAQKLANLQITVHDLRRKLEITEKSKKGKGFEFDSLKEQLEESEETIMRLFEFNRKLIKSIEDNSSISFNEETSSAPDENATSRRRKVSEQARRVSEKIGRLQLEVQKLQFLLLKLDDENKSSGKTRIIERKTRVLLRDYLYGGTRTSQKRKKGHFCSCVQPPTSD